MTEFALSLLKDPPVVLLSSCCGLAVLYPWFAPWFYSVVCGLAGGFYGVVRCLVFCVHLVW